MVFFGNQVTTDSNLAAFLLKPEGWAMLYYRIETAHTSERICKQVFSVGDYITAMKRGRTGSKEVKATEKQYL